MESMLIYITHLTNGSLVTSIKHTYVQLQTYTFEPKPQAGT